MSAKAEFCQEYVSISVCLVLVDLLNGGRNKDFWESRSRDKPKYFI